MLIKKEVSKAIIASAVSRAVDECIQEDILKDFFLSHKQEVIEMSIMECTAEEQLKAIADGYYEDGYNNGTEMIIGLFSWLNKNNRNDDIERALSDKGYLAKMIEEYKETHRESTLLSNIP